MTQRHVGQLRRVLSALNDQHMQDGTLLWVSPGQTAIEALRHVIEDMEDMTQRTIGPDGKDELPQQKPTSGGFTKACEIVASLSPSERGTLLMSGMSHNPTPRECQPLKQEADHRILGDPAGGVTMQSNPPQPAESPDDWRRDLPPITHKATVTYTGNGVPVSRVDDEPDQQQKRKTVRLWMHDIGGTVICGTRPSQGWKEIHVDPATGTVFVNED